MDDAHDLVYVYDFSDGVATCRACRRTDYLHELDCPGSPPVVTHRVYWDRPGTRAVVRYTADVCAGHLRGMPHVIKEGLHSRRPCAFCNPGIRLRFRLLRGERVRHAS